MHHCLHTWTVRTHKGHLFPHISVSGKTACVDQVFVLFNGFRGIVVKKAWNKHYQIMQKKQITELWLGRWN